MDPLDVVSLSRTLIDIDSTTGRETKVAQWLAAQGASVLVTYLRREPESFGVSAAEATNPLGAIMPPKGGAGITEAQVRSVAAYVWALSH